MSTIPTPIYSAANMRAKLEKELAEKEAELVEHEWYYAELRDNPRKQQDADDNQRVLGYMAADIGVLRRRIDPDGWLKLITEGRCTS